MRGPEPVGMSNLTLPPVATDRATSHTVAGPCPGGAPDDSVARPPTSLLPSDATPASGPRPAPSRALARDALRLLPRLSDASRRPARWIQPAFGREIEQVRTHLAVVRSRAALAESYRRESFHFGSPADVDDAGPVRIAYALRWLELGDGVVGPTWAAMMGPCG